MGEKLGFETILDKHTTKQENSIYEFHCIGCDCHDCDYNCEECDSCDCDSNG